MALRRFSKLFQSGPVQTSKLVKDSVLIDFGSRDPNFGRQVEDIKSRILSFSQLDPSFYNCIIMQGPSSYISESLISTIKPSENLLILSNGSIGSEMESIASVLKKPFKTQRFSEKITASSLSSVNFDNVSHVAMVHEESTGLLNPINEISSYIRNKYPGVTQIVNGSQAFDWIYLKFNEIDFYYSGFHGVVQGFNGISFCIANNSVLDKAKGKFLSLALDLQDQCQYQKENPGQFRFTPPTHLVAAAYSGIREWESEGVNARFLRLQKVKEKIINTLSLFGFDLYHPPQDLGYSCIPLKFPTHKNWNFPHFCAHLKRKGYVINPQHMQNPNLIELGTAGDITLEDVIPFLKAIEETLKEMRIPIPIKTI